MYIYESFVKNVQMFKELQKHVWHTSTFNNLHQSRTYICEDLFHKTKVFRNTYVLTSVRIEHMMIICALTGGCAGANLSSDKCSRCAKVL
jgi:hypothetical protein